MSDEFLSTAKPTNRSISHTDAEICVNCWYLTDDLGIVLRIAAKAYALRGSDAEKLAVLSSLAGTDHLNATLGRVPSKFVTEVAGKPWPQAVPESHMRIDPIPVFEDLLKEIEKNFPLLYKANGNDYVNFKLGLQDPLLWVLTGVYESPNGELIARVQ